MEWVEDILWHFLLGFLDQGIYSFIGTVYNLLINISETTIFSKDVFTAFSDRIYGILGIFMLFKVSFSILSYIANPDDFTDKNKGFNKMISNILITLVLLVATPWIFDQAMEVQSIILKENILGKIILGGDKSNIGSTVNPGKTMAYETLTAFYYIDVDYYPACSDFVYGTSKEASSCVNSINGLTKDSGEIIKTLEYAKKSQNVTTYIDAELYTARDGEGNYILKRVALIPTLAGGFIVLILISFCFDVAVRSIKLGFMRMIAPVPIISRIDPKKGKEVFDKWVKNCISTYIDLFVRLLAIYFAVFVVTQILYTENENFTNAGLLVKVFIIMGALLFAKQLPKLLGDILGVKLDGSAFSLNPIKRLGEVPVVGKSAAGLANRGLDAGRRGLGAAAGIAWDSKLNTPLRNAKNGVTDWKNANAAKFAETDFGRRYTGGDAYDNKISKLDELAKFKSQLKDQADYDTKSQGNYTDLAGHVYVDDNTKAAKQRYDDLKSSGTASVQSITEAREHYEDLQKNSIKNGNTETIKTIKENMANFVSANGNVIGDIHDLKTGEVVRITKDSSYDDINAAAVHAQNKVVETKNSQGYIDAQKAKAAKATKKQSSSKK